MQYRPLGRTGLVTSEIALGTWAFSSTSYGTVDESTAIDAIRSALDVGVTLFDTAPLYGTADQDGIAELILGKGLGRDRAKVLISTKFGRNPSDGCGPNFDAERVLRSVEESLQRLQTDWIDILFFHSPFSAEEIHEDVWGALGQLKKSGKIRVVGHSLSMFQQTEHMARVWAADGRIDVIQTVYSLMNRESSRLIGDLGQQGVGVVARESLANGFLTGAIQRDTVFPPNNLNSRYSRDEIIERVEQAEVYRDLLVTPQSGAKQELTSLAQAAMRWVLDNPFVSTVLTGAKNRQELVDCAAASDAKGFTREQLQAADQMHRRDYPGA